MNHSVKWMGAVAALLLSAAGALGQSAPAADQLPAGSQLQYAAPQPKGIPGYLDPATGLFQPLPQPEAAPTTYAGTIHVKIDLTVGRGLQNANIQCAIGLQFGREVGTDFFSEQNMNVIFEFPANSPPTIDIPFVYKTNTDDPKGNAQASCQASGGTGGASANSFPELTLLVGLFAELLPHDERIKELQDLDVSLRAAYGL